MDATSLLKGTALARSLQSAAGMVSQAKELAAWAKVKISGRMTAAHDKKDS